MRAQQSRAEEILKLNGGCGPLGPVCKCHGLKMDGWEGLCEMRHDPKTGRNTQYGGAVDVVKYLWDLELSDQFPECSTYRDFELQHSAEHQALLGQIKTNGKALYYGDGNSLVSNFCDGLGIFNGTCVGCLLLYFQSCTRKRVANLHEADGAVGKKARRDQLTFAQMHQRLDDATDKVQKQGLQGLNQARGWLRCQKRYDKVLGKLKSLSQRGDKYPTFIRYLQLASALGQLDDHAALMDV